MKYNRKKALTVFILILVSAFFIFIFYKGMGPYLKIFHRPRQIKQWIMSFGKLSFLAYVILQIVQVIVCIVPGEFIQAAGGYIFGTFWGTILSLVGILIGSIITFFIARTFGERLLSKILPQRHFSRIELLINKPKNNIILFVLYLIPGVPKDVLGYVSGITPIKIREFAIICTVARIPGVLFSTFFGANLYYQNNIILVIVVIIVLLLLVIGASQREKILAYIR